MASVVSVISVGMAIVLVFVVFAAPTANLLAVPLSLCFVLLSLLAGLVAKQREAISRLEKLVENEKRSS